MLKILLRSLCYLSVLAYSWPACADSYLNELVRDARVKKLADQPQWHALLHYKSRWGSWGLRSLADDPRFFASPRGKTNPQAELEATLESFFSLIEETDKIQNPQCRFIARYQWLKKELSFDSARLPEQPCKRFSNWRGALDPERITLVFASAYMNNPSSAYGHTLLRIDGRDQDDKTNLLAYAVSYAARADDANALIFGIKGIFGGYDGTFAMSPYYVKVSEYNDVESRDLWEYELDLTPEEIDRVIMHVWELGPTRFDYYFFDENCAYQLLALIDAARPSLRLTEKFPSWAIPSDTVRAVTEEPGLLRRVAYRPARSTILRERVARMQDRQIDISKRLAQGSLAPNDASVTQDSESSRIQELELAYDYLDYRRERGEAKGAEIGERLRQLLSARSKISAASELTVPTPSVRPDEGHRSARVSLGIGQRESVGFQELRLRPAYHDLLDPQEGYPLGAQIDFFYFIFRRQQDSIKLERMDLASVVSLSPRDQLLKPISWTATLGASRLRREDGTNTLRAQIVGGGGLAYKLGNPVLAYALVEGAFQASSKIEHGYALGPGLHAGAYFDVNERWRIGAKVRGFRFMAGEQHDAWEASLNQRVTLSGNWTLRIEASEQREFGLRATTLSAHVNYYF